MRRRDFITLLGSATAWPIAARAQQPAVPVIGFLYGGETNSSAVAAFRKGLGEVGYVEGRNLAIEYRWAQNDYSLLPELAADLVNRHVAVIAVPGAAAGVVAAKAATTTIPIVFGMGGADPVEFGFVASLNRPGGNLTGITSMNTDLGAKRLGLLHELLPKAERFAVLVNPNQPAAQSIATELRTAASAINRQIEVLAAGNKSDIDSAFAELLQKRVDALLVSPNSLFRDRRAQLTTLTARHAMPAIYDVREIVEIGGLMSYGSSGTDQFRQVGTYTGRILKGEKPAEMPVMRATKFEFLINLQTAKTLGLTVPQSLLAIADEVIE
jgi:putative ABC transport system substrate-binding protein